MLARPARLWRRGFLLRRSRLRRSSLGHRDLRWSIRDRLNVLNLLVEFAVGIGDAPLISFVALTPDRRELGEALEPGVVQLAQSYDLVLVVRCFAQRGLIGTRHRQLVLLDARLGLGAVNAFLRAVEPELDNFDALDVPAHRVRLRDRLEKAIDARALRLGRADVGIDLVECVRKPGLEPCRDRQEEDERKTKHLGDPSDRSGPCYRAAEPGSSPRVV